jgi:hypothetical protein
VYNPAVLPDTPYPLYLFHGLATSSVVFRLADAGLFVKDFPAKNVKLDPSAVLGTASPDYRIAALLAMYY